MSGHPDADLAVQALTDTQLTRWVLRHIKGWSIDRIARLQGVSKTAIRESLDAAERAIERSRP
ncbi:MAG: hypothetical protein AB7O78_01785 [Thermoleophilia bacterium]